MWGKWKISRGPFVENFLSHVEISCCTLTDLIQCNIRVCNTRIHTRACAPVYIYIYVYLYIARRSYIDPRVRYMCTHVCWTLTCVCVCM